MESIPHSSIAAKNSFSGVCAFVSAIVVPIAFVVVAAVSVGAPTALLVSKLWSIPLLLLSLSLLSPSYVVWLLLVVVVLLFPLMMLVLWSSPLLSL